MIAVLFCLLCLYCIEVLFAISAITNTFMGMSQLLTENFKMLFRLLGMSKFVMCVFRLLGVSKFVMCVRNFRDL